MRVHYFCFLAAALSALTGMGLGVAMGASGDFTLAPAHAHLNLLGWVTMALYGLHHRGAEGGSLRLAWAQAVCGAAGAALMAGGLAAYLATLDPAPIRAVAAGALLSMAAMAIFLAIVLTDLRRARSRRAGRDGARPVARAAR